MKKSFEDFIEDFPMFQSLRENLHAKEVFDILNRDENIFLAVEFSKRSKPALLASIFLKSKNSSIRSKIQHSISRWISIVNALEKCSWKS